MRLLDQLHQTPVLIATGTGGVGKTTMSCALAIGLANTYDARVLVITIDPAKRLASVLCEEELGHEPRAIDINKFTEDIARGEVFAAMVHSEEGWRDLITRYAKSESDAKRIFENKLYKNLTSRFSHSHDFIAMDQLFEHYRSGQYDFIVLDTPPSSQAFGFFDAPQAMSEFFGGKLVRLVTSPYRLGKGRAAKLFDFASQPFFALADKVLGKQFLNEIGEFFFLFHTMYDQFAARSKDITGFITSNRCHAAIVSDPSQFLSNLYLETEKGLLERKINATHLLINNVPFAQDEIDEVKYEHENLHDKSFALLIEHDIEISEAVYEKLADNMRGFAQLEDVGHRVAIARALEIDESERLKALVGTVQRASIFDDTM
jgi:anion-transporting  ArsA/GET3 family ATPase